MRIPHDSTSTIGYKEGKNIGEVAQVIVESSEKRATHIVVTQGFLSKEHRLVPTLWITDATEEVHLLIDADLFEGLPEIQKEVIAS